MSKYTDAVNEGITRLCLDLQRKEEMALRGDEPRYTITAFMSCPDNVGNDPVDDWDSEYDADDF
jgi:hypothetical protein